MWLFHYLIELSRSKALTKISSSKLMVVVRKGNFKLLATPDLRAELPVYLNCSFFVLYQKG
ncbi:hypothetical protein DAPPUDRAFT_262779 [Daphnia pulex]|uniref:Uncharacterized protein n=1 Tax=Daphnia pulex TaxID=6669 RepID=E9HNN7_DAPPU|nr:hypothetical protein DAPPUDRAFT_262779 [Daphnia pulex]|eukprot:EFX66639.1 hypothetical protein DAPPUDRAFT_262779 [Daphnia pulex]